MKLIVTICLCSVLLAQLGRAQNETSATEATKVPSTELPAPSPEPSPSTETSTVASSTPVISSVIQETATSPVTEAATSPTTSQATSEETTKTPVSESTPVTPATNKTKTKLVDKLSDQIRSILNHFQDPNPTGFPGQTVLTDPMSVPNRTVDLGLGTGYLYNLTVHELSNFTVEAVNLLLDEMQVYVMIHLNQIVVKGNCTVETMFTKSRGPFNMTLSNVTADGTVSLRADAEGKLYANKSSTDMTYQELLVGSSGGSVFQSMLNGAGMVLLSTIKPDILNHIDTRLNEEVNKQLENTPKIPSISNTSPVDLAIMEGRKYVRRLYDPYTIESFANHESEFLSVKIGPVTISGLSKFARVGNITVQMRDGVVQVIVRLITGRLKGKCRWFYDFAKTGLTGRGDSLFAVDHVQFEAKVNQSMNLKKTPILDDLQLEVGTIHVKMGGGGNFDYLLDMTAHLIPDMLRHFIIDALEEPIKQKIQSEVLDKINAEKLVEDNLSLVETYFI